MKRHAVILISLLPIFTAAVGCGTQGTQETADQADSRASSPRGPTKIIETAPVDSNHRAVAGLMIEEKGQAQICSAASESAGARNAYRCFGGRFIYDPCWKDETEPDTQAVLCMTRPWDRHAFRLTLAPGRRLEPFRTPPRKAGTRSPWGVELTTGERCELVHGSRGAIRRGDRLLVLDYPCDDKAGRSTGRSLIRGMDRSGKQWRVTGITHTQNRDKLSPGLRIVKAWYAYEEEASFNRRRRATPRAEDPSGAPYVVHRFFSPGDFPSNRAYYTGEMSANHAAEPTIGEQLPSAARVAFRRLPNPGELAVWHVSISAKGKHADWYAFVKSKGGKELLSAVRTLSVSSPIAAAGGPGFRLALSADSAIKRFGLAHLGDLKQIAAWFSEHPDGAYLQPSSNGSAAAVLNRLNLASAATKPGYGRDVFIGIAGITDNVAGLAYVPKGGRVPAMDSAEFIYVERIAPGWYVYKTT